MATPKFRHHGPLDVWSVKERLALACSVLRSGDQNWVSVSRAIKPYGEVSRPPEWFSQKNCALQYAELLEKAETPKRKRGDRGEIETPGIQIIRKLSIERMEELKKKVLEQQQKYKKLKREVESIKSGQMDDKLPEIWQQMQLEKKAAEEARQERKLAEESESKPRKGTVSRLFADQGNLDVENIKQEPNTEPVSVSRATDSTVPQVPKLTLKTDLPTPTEEKPKPTSASDVLSSLLQSEHITVNQLQQLKTETELNLKQELQAQQLAAMAASQAAAAQQTTVTPEEPAPTTSTIDTPEVVASLTDMLEKSEDIADEISAIIEPNIGATETSNDVPDDKSVDAMVAEEVVTEEEEEKTEVTTEDDEDTRDSAVEVLSKDGDLQTPKVEDIPEDSTESADVQSTSFINVDDEISIKEEEPLSPASSVSSKLSESDTTKNIKRRGRGRSRGGRRPSRRPRRIILDDEKKEDPVSRLSEGETTEDEEDPGSSSLSQMNLSTSGTFSESIPNSPLSHCSDTEDEKNWKNWKKSIMLVWKSIASHKYANVFLHPVTEDIAPGYSSIVFRPMDLGTIKKNVESGAIRTIAEFQRDMMLMFTNAIMYNSSNHNVYKMAVEMYKDVMQHIEQYVSTQLMVQSTDTKHLRTTRRVDNSSDKEEDPKRRRASTDTHIHSEGGKAKKRKI